MFISSKPKANLEFRFRQNKPKTSNVFKVSEVFFGFYIVFWLFDIV